MKTPAYRSLPNRCLPWAGILIACLLLPARRGASAPLGYALRPVPFNEVHVTDAFWSRRLATNRLATLPHIFRETAQTGRIDNFRKATGRLKGRFEGYFFNDSDVYKLIEAAAYSLETHSDADLDRKLDGFIAVIAAAQRPDGYLYTARELAGPDYRPPGGMKRWSDVSGGHELYCAGHLYEAAVAHYRATGKRTLLDVALKNADLVCSVFNEHGKRNPPGHPEIEIGLVKLYRVTGNRKYLREAKFFIDQRGRPDGHHLYGTYSQDQEPIVDQDEAVGHAVRAAYLYSGVTDVSAWTGDTLYRTALDRLWRNVVGKKLYLTGGIGAAGGWEGFGPNYVLPNLTAYSETCASVANILWNDRMFNLEGDARYVDVFERVLYNALLSGVSLDGRRFFYSNPLESDGQNARSPWFACACCPPNLARLLPQVPGFIYAREGNKLYANLFIGSRARIHLDSGWVSIDQHTLYPWEGRVRWTFHPTTANQRFTFSIRVPGWARNQPVASDLYRFQTPSDQRPEFRLNGAPLEITSNHGYVALRRTWQEGDAVEANFPMPIRRVVSNAHVEADRGKVAFQRGPLVYCVEWPDVKDKHVVNLVIPDDSTMSAAWHPDLLGGVEVLQGEAVSLRYADAHRKLARQKVTFQAIPYYTWANRGRGEMAVWLARTPSAARPLPFPTIASTSHASASRGDAQALNDQREPQSSHDHTNRYLHWWPHKGTKEWAQYDFAHPARVSAVDVYWFDDTGMGECRLPQSWSLFYRIGGKWKPVPHASVYGCAGDRYNRTTFDPVLTDGLRLEVQLRPRFSSGIHEWKVEAAP